MSNSSGLSHKVLPSIWDADDDEFDRWPVQEPEQPSVATDPGNVPSDISNDSHAYAEPLILAERYLTLRDASHRRSPFTHKVPSTGSNSGKSSNGSEAGRPQRSDFEDGLGLQHLEVEDYRANTLHATITELQDPKASNPFGEDMNDELLKPFFSKKYRSLPPSTPARHMHIIDTADLVLSKDPVVQYLRPRLCEGVATVLYETSPKCLDAFFDSTVNVFEWRRDVTRATKRNQCGVIRRSGNQVLVSLPQSLHSV
jgi:hypothetical protein